MKKLKCFEKNTSFIIMVIMIFTAITRLAALDKMPEGINVDEAYGAYNAWALLTEGIDSRGYTNPVYFVAWGSGMNVLYSYLAIPFFKLLGASIWVYRLPQALTGICGVYIFYLLGKEFFDEKIGCLLAFVLAINPWHFRNMRYGLESNLAPGMFLIAVCFLVYALKKNHKFLIPSAVVLGATLYAYSLAWIVVPVFLVFFLIFFRKKIPLKVTTLISGLILLALATPLLMFVGVNLGLLEEVRTPLISIPKLSGFRADELNGVHILDRILQVLHMFFNSYDNMSPGLYYLFTAPFACFGIVYHLITFIKGHKNGDNAPEYIMLLWFFSAFAMCMLHEEINSVHANLLHIPVIFYGVYGIWKAGIVLKNKKILPVCLAAWILSFGFFAVEYVTTEDPYMVKNSAGEAIERAKEIVADDGTVNIYKYSTIKYSYLLWHEKPSPTDFYQNVEYTFEVEEWAEVKSYQNFCYVNSVDELEENNVYIIRKDMEDTFYDLGYDIEAVNETYSIAM